MLESSMQVIQGTGVGLTNGVDVAKQNIKNREADSPELGSSAEELAQAQNAWEGVQCIEPSRAGTSSTNTLEKKQHHRTPSQSSTPSLIFVNNTTNKTSSPAPNFASSHPSLHHIEKQQQKNFDNQFHHSSTKEQHQQSWSSQHQVYQQNSYQYSAPKAAPQSQPHLHNNRLYQSHQQQQYSGNGSRSSLIVGVKVTPTIDFDEAWEFFTRQDMSHAKTTIRPVMERKGVTGLLRGLFGPRRLILELVSERDLLFCIAQCPLSNSQPLHLQMLQTIYRRLTGTRVDCQRYGPHWDIIGFQGSDPATDLRGVGLLGLLQMVSLVCGEQSQHLAGDVFALSHDQHSQFPLLVLCLNVTRITLQALREGCLNKECNSRGNVRHVLNEYFAAVLFYIYHIWRTERKSITDSGYLIKVIRVSKSCSK
uniref:ELMO domain-containing protein 3 n=1 Tax=Hirondellea gigas TaxID=1518452 RepID=A0A6A7G7A0_9CRUS